MPFRRAHHVTGAIVKLAEGKGCGIEDLSLAEMQAIEPGITDGVFDVLTVDASVSSRTSLWRDRSGQCAEQAARARDRFLG